MCRECDDALKEHAKLKRLAWHEYDEGNEAAWEKLEKVAYEAWVRYLRVRRANHSAEARE
jgi:hypothetical protein